MLVPRRALAALLVAASPRALAWSDAPASSPSSSSSPAVSQPDRLRDLLREAKHLPPRVDAVQPSAPSRDSRAQLTAARQLLDRYYALSADVIQHAAAAEQRVDAKPRVSDVGADRASAEQVFRPLSLHTISGPACVKYVIVGAGTAAWAAIDAILQRDPHAAAQILLVSDEPYLPYNRTMLSKELFERDQLQSSPSPSQVQYAYKHFKPQPQAAQVSVANDTAVLLDPDLKFVQLASGHRITYDKLLLATGGVPRAPLSVAPALHSPNLSQYVSTFRTLQDYYALRDKLQQQPDQSVAVVGGGFLGTELALALTALSNNVSLVITEPGVLFRVLPRFLCQFLAKRLEKAGVNVVQSAVITDASVSADDKKVTLHIDFAEPMQLDANHVVVAVGIDPSTQLAKTAGLEIDPNNAGIRVNDFMMVEPDVFAAGDVASFHDRTLGRRRVEHWDHAVVSGNIAGANMTGARERYKLQSMFWSDLSAINVHFTAVGLVDSALQTVSVWNLTNEANVDLPSLNEFASGVVYYLNERGEIVGVVLWNPKRGAGGLRRARALVDAKTNVELLDEHTLAALVNLEHAEIRHSIRTKSCTG